MKTLHTTRLLLRPWEVSDAQSLYTQAHNPIIGKRRTSQTSLFRSLPI